MIKDRAQLAAYIALTYILVGKSRRIYFSACQVSDDVEIRVYKIAQQCQKALEGIQSNAP